MHLCFILLIFVVVWLMGDALVLYTADFCGGGCLVDTADTADLVVVVVWLMGDALVLNTADLMLMLIFCDPS